MIETYDDGQVVINFQGDLVPYPLSSKEKGTMIDAVGFVPIPPGEPGRLVDLELDKTEFAHIFMMFNSPASVEVMIETLQEVKAAMENFSDKDLPKPWLKLR